MRDDQPPQPRPHAATSQPAGHHPEHPIPAPGDHARFCILTDARRAKPEDAHGPWCVSTPVGPELRGQATSGPVDITIDLAAPYPDGTVSEAAQHRYVRLLQDRPGSGREDTYLDAEVARALAASLICAADQLDERSDRP